MYCPHCSHANPADATHCTQCKRDLSEQRKQLFIGRQFIFVQADESQPIMLDVDGAMQTFSAPAILSRHQHAVRFGDDAPPAAKKGVRRPPARRDVITLADQPRLPHPSLDLLTVTTDRKIYKPDTEAAIFIVAPDAAGGPAALEIKLGGQKVYETKVTLNQDGLALHTYPDLKEGEYVVLLTLPGRGNIQAECNFSVAEFTLSPLIAVLHKHAYAQKHLTFTLNLLLLSQPYSGEVEFGLQCQVCGEQVVATQKVQAKDGLAEGDFDVSSHGGPFHVQVTTPDGNTASVAFPGTGVVEREHIRINSLGQQFEAGLLPWEGAEPVRSLYIGPGAVNMTPLTLESVHAERGCLQVASDLTPAQLVTFDPRSGEQRATDFKELKRGGKIEFGVSAPYMLFTVGGFTRDKPFEGWGVVIKPAALQAELNVPAAAQPGQEIDVQIELKPPAGAAEGQAESAFCLLLVYDARLEHESPLPKLAKRIYESMRDASRNLAAGPVANVIEQMTSVPEDILGRGSVWRGGPLRAAMPMMARATMAADVDYSPAQAGESFKSLEPAPAGALAADKTEAEVEAATLTMVVAPTRMEFPELAFLELFYLEGQAARTVKLGDQIGTWRARAYLFKAADYRELSADIQADKPLYAELDLPAIASAGDDISAAVNYFTRQPSELIITTLFGETRQTVNGSGAARFPIQGPGRVEVRIEAPQAADWSVRDVAAPGVQKVTASRLMILDKGQTARGEKVVVYASMGQVLKDTITALIHYPFG